LIFSIVAVAEMVSGPEVEVKTTLSAVVEGTPLGDQVAAEFQFPPAFDTVLTAIF
jgi:hypothetical protein